MSNIKTMTRGTYDLQKLRVSTGNRLVGNFKVKIGQKPSESESELDAEGKKILLDLRRSYKKITDGIKKLPTLSKFKGDEVISTYAELALVDTYIRLESEENRNFRLLGKILEDEPIYARYLKKIKGCGAAMSGVVISEIDITKAKYPSSLWAYAGLDVASDGKGRSRRKEHLVETAYTKKDGTESIRQGITFNPFLKTKLIGVLASSFLRAKDNEYARLYYEYKNRLENHPNHTEKSKGHRHNMAMRYMIKRFLCDLYVAWRTMEGLPVEKEYGEAKLGHVHTPKGNRQPASQSVSIKTSKPSKENESIKPSKPTFANESGIDSKPNATNESKPARKPRSENESGLERKPSTANEANPPRKPMSKNESKPISNPI